MPAFGGRWTVLEDFEPDEFLFLDGVCARALPAADFDALEVRPSRRVLDAAEAAACPVWRFGVPVCERALPEDFFVDLAVLLFVSVLEALEAAFLPVVFVFLGIGSSALECSFE